MSAGVFTVIAKVWLSAKGADLTLAAAPFAAGIGQAHHHIPAFAVSLAKGFQDLLGDERTGWPAEHSLLVVCRCEAYISVPLEESLHHGVVTQALWGIFRTGAEWVLQNI